MTRRIVENSTDAWSPQEIAHRVEDVGVSKARAHGLTVFVLAVLAGAFIAMGAIFFTAVMAEGASRLVGGLAFCLGLVLVVVAGAELFTGNNLIAMAWASKRIRTRELLRNWGIVYLGNIVGALGTVALVALSGIDTVVGEKALAIGEAKAELGIVSALVRGILCNAMVCLAVWLAMGGRSVTDKILAVLFPITAFVVLGFEHSIANWFFLPYAIVLDGGFTSDLWTGALHNLTVVTLGNVIGGSLLVAGIYWLAYLRQSDQA